MKSKITILRFKNSKIMRCYSYIFAGVRRTRQSFVFVLSGLHGPSPRSPVTYKDDG